MGTAIRLHIRYRTHARTLKGSRVRGRPPRSTPVVRSLAAPEPAPSDTTPAMAGPYQVRSAGPGPHTVQSTRKRITPYGRSLPRCHGATVVPARRPRRGTRRKTEVARQHGIKLVYVPPAPLGGPLFGPDCCKTEMTPQYVHAAVPKGTGRRRQSGAVRPADSARASARSPTCSGARRSCVCGSTPVNVFSSTTDSRHRANGSVPRAVRSRPHPAPAGVDDGPHL